MRHPIFWLLAGFTLWSLAFLALYAVQATGCSLAGESTTLRWLLIAGLAASFISVTALVFMLRKTESRGFIRDVGTKATLAASASVIFCFSGVFWLSLCQ